MEKKEINFEENIKALEKIVEELESGNVPLDKALEKFNEGIKLSKECQNKLEEVSSAVNKILNEDGTLSDFKVEE